MAPCSAVDFNASTVCASDAQTVKNMVQTGTAVLAGTDRRIIGTVPSKTVQMEGVVPWSLEGSPKIHYALVRVLRYRTRASN